MGILGRDFTQIVSGGLLAILLFLITPFQGTAKEYILTAVKPNTLVLADPEARKVVKMIPIPGPGAPGSISVSPDGKIAYVLTNRLESISGIHLDSGKQFFRANFSTKERRIKQMFAQVISPDGRELYSVQSIVRFGKGEYIVEEPRIAVYRTSSINAQPIRVFNVSRKIQQMYISTDGKYLYAVAWDILKIDAQTGEVVDTLKVANWDRKNFYPPDLFGVWSHYSQAQVFVNPYFAMRSDKSPDDPTAYVTGMLTIDLKTGEFQMNDFENTEAIMFSSVVNPVRRNEAFSVYTTLTKSDLNTHKLIKRVPLEHTYYNINISGDGKEVYVGGTMGDIGIYSSETLEKIGSIDIPGAPNMGISWLRMIHR